MNSSLPIALETKDLLGLLLLPAGILAATIALLGWPKLRVIALFLLAAGLPASGMFDLNIYSAYWYRGTTRGFEVSVFDVIAFALLFSTMLSPRANQPRGFWPASLGFMLLYLLYCTISTLSATPMVFGLFEVSKLVRGLVFFLAAAFFVRRTEDLGWLALGLSVAILAESALAIRERLLLDIYRPAGTLFHPNSLSMYFCMAVPVLIAAACADFPRWVRWTCWAASLAGAATIFLALSRAGLPIFVVVAGGALVWCGSWRPTPGKLAAGLVAVGILTAVGIKAWPSVMERYGQATMAEEYFEGQGETRGYYFRQAGVILDQNPFGVGLNNWSYWVSREYSKPLGMHYETYDNLAYAPPSELMPQYRFAAPAHNLGVLTAGEIGWAGLGLLTVLWLRWLWMGAGFIFSRQATVFHRLGVGLFFGFVGVFLHSFTEWTFRQTEIFLSFNLLAGVMAALISVKREATATARAGAEAAPAEPAWEPAPAVPLRPAFNPTVH
jgi:hypothetical protein